MAEDQHESEWRFGGSVQPESCELLAQCGVAQCGVAQYDTSLARDNELSAAGRGSQTPLMYHSYFYSMCDEIYCQKENKPCHHLLNNTSCFIYFLPT